MRYKPIQLAAALSIALLAAGPARSQLRQYRLPGTLAAEEVPAREQIRERLADAPWVWGRFRVQPRFALGDFVYNANVFDANDSGDRESDLRGNVTGGITAYLPAGSDFVLAGFVLPSYAWWQNNDQLSRLNWSYGVAGFGLYNRLSTEITIRRNEQERRLNNELRTPITTRQDRIGIDAVARIRGPWRLFAGAAYVENRYPTADLLADQVPNLRSLERDEDVVHLGLEYDIPGRFRLGAGWRRVSSDFLDPEQTRSNNGEYPFARILVPGNRLRVTGEVGLRKAEFEEPSDLEPTEEAIGTLRFTFRLATRTNLTFYGGRDLVYSAVDGTSYFTSQRSGVELGWGAEQRLRIGFFAESGDDIYASGGGSNLGRRDVGEAYGGRMVVPLRNKLWLLLSAIETTIESNFDDFDRSTTELLANLRLEIDLPDVPF